MTLRTLTLLLMTLSLALSTVACGDDATTDDTTTDAAGDEAGADDAAGDEAGADDAAGDEAGADDAAEETEDDAETPWGAVCATDADCAAPTDFCVMQPGATEGYCSIECPNLGADCTYEDWTCNIVGTCNAPMATWCGPPSEIEEGGGVVVACE